MLNFLRMLCTVQLFEKSSIWGHITWQLLLSLCTNVCFLYVLQCCFFLLLNDHVTNYEVTSVKVRLTVIPLVPTWERRESATAVQRTDGYNLAACNDFISSFYPFPFLSSKRKVLQLEDARIVIIICKNIVHPILLYV